MPSGHAWWVGILLLPRPAQTTVSYQRVGVCCSACHTFTERSSLRDNVFGNHRDWDIFSAVLCAKDAAVKAFLWGRRLKTEEARLAISSGHVCMTSRSMSSSLGEKHVQFFGLAASPSALGVVWPATAPEAVAPAPCLVFGAPHCLTLSLGFCLALKW